MHDESTVLIPLTQGKFAIVDAEDAEHLLRYSWKFIKGRNKHVGYAYRARTKDDGPGPATIYMHREILGTPSGVLTDHVDGDGLHNRRQNLRQATHQQNNINRRGKIGSTSPYKGVDWKRDKRCWRARIESGEERIHIGCFSDPIAAAAAYDERAIVMFGEYARLNFPEST